MSYQEQSVDRVEAGFRPLDILTLGYAFFELAVILLFMSEKPGWQYFAIFYAAVGSLALVLSMVPMQGAWKALRLTYPLLIIILLYQSLDRQIFLIHRVPFDAAIFDFEMSYFGFNLYFGLQYFMEIWLNEIMSLAYMSYYVMIPTALLIFITRRLWDKLEKFVLTTCLTFFISYVIFLIYPVVGPRIYLEDIFFLPLVGPYFTPLAQKIVLDGGLFGGAMPSSHCAVALVAVWYLFGEFKQARAALFVLLIMLCLSTVYGRYHYVSDVVVGLGVGVIGLAVGSIWQKQFNLKREAACRRLKPEPDSPVEVGIED